MYHAKDLGRDNCQYYSAALTDMAVQRMELQSSLRLALERGEFHLEYQPQFDAADGRVFSVEALLRWRHPERGAVPPLEFIPLAEENGLIIPIGRWVLRTACADAARWQQAGMPLRVAVNLSPLQLRDPDLVPSVRAALADTQLAPDLLELELRQLGVRVALDDFGTGYSSMSYLKRMPLSNLKIDRRFVNGLPADAEDYAIVRAILSLAKSLGFSVTAEGVETREQVRALRNMACDTLQGYYFSRPVPAAEIPALVAAAAVPAAPALQVAAGGRR
jgi:EAL domain-containing protein (putative c-di-GMP-specific phosphodiesterase class I)